MASHLVDEIEEFQSEDVASLNHSRVVNRLCVALDQYDEEFDTFPELELELSTGKCKPDLCIYPNLTVDWYNDTLYFTHSPLVAIEILSPRQALNELTDKAFKQYFPAGVKSVWIVVPLFRTIQILLSDGSLQIASAMDRLRDPITHIEIDLPTIFR
jgi:Uma2 family endonuclease